MKNKANIIGGIFLSAAAVIFSLTFIEQRAGATSTITPDKNSRSLALSALDTPSQDSERSVLLPEEEYADSIFGPIEPVPDSYWEMEPRPYEVSNRSTHFEWTSANGKTHSVMRQLATNPENLDQMQDENPWTMKRQLLYLSDNFQSEAQNVFNGTSKTLTIPGFDGEEFRVNVADVEILEREPKFAASFAFTFEDRPDVTGQAALVGDIWSIGYKRPEDGFYQDAISRRAGELILSRFDIETESQHGNGCAGCGHCNGLHTDNDVGLGSTEE